MVSPIGEDLPGYLNPLTGAYHDTSFSRFVRAAVATRPTAASLIRTSCCSRRGGLSTSR